MRSALATGIFGIALLFTTGCQPPPRAMGPTYAVVRAPHYESMVADTMTVLRENEFEPARLSREQGRLVTAPRTSQQFFEFWRHDAIGPYQFFESSVHTTRRIVRVQFLPLDEPARKAQAAGLHDVPAADLTGEYRLVVQVDKERYSAPERQITTASGALRIYNEALPTEEGIRRSRDRSEHWIPQGRDVLLENYLLSKILKRIPGVEVVSRQSGVSEDANPTTEPAPPTENDEILTPAG